MNMSDRIKQRRLEMKLTQEELASSLGLQKSAIAKYENGRVENVKRSTIELMSTILECKPSYLMGWDEPAPTKPSYSNILPITKKSFPLLGSVACGTPILAEEKLECYVQVGTDLQADFCLKAKGDSMINARIHNGDIIFIRSQSSVNNGEIAVVVIEEEATLKRVFYYPEKEKLVLQAENPICEPLVYVGSELEHIHILGKAVAFQSDVR